MAPLSCAAPSAPVLWMLQHISIALCSQLGVCLLVVCSLSVSEH